MNEEGLEVSNQRDGRGLTRVLAPAFLAYKAHDVVLCTFSTRISTAAARFTRSSQLSSSRPGPSVLSVRECGMDRPSQHNCTFTLLKPANVPPCWVISLVFGLIVSNAASTKKVGYTLSHGWVTLLWPARRASVLGHLSSLRPHCFQRYLK